MHVRFGITSLNPFSSLKIIFTNQYNRLQAHPEIHNTLQTMSNLLLERSLRICTWQAPSKLTLVSVMLVLPWSARKDKRFWRIISLIPDSLNFLESWTYEYGKPMLVILHASNMQKQWSIFTMTILSFSPLEGTTIQNSGGEKIVQQQGYIECMPFLHIKAVPPWIQYQWHWRIYHWVMFCKLYLTAFSWICLFVYLQIYSIHHLWRSHFVWTPLRIFYLQA